MQRQQILGGLVVLAVTAAVLLGVKLRSSEPETETAEPVWVTVPMEGARSPDGKYEVRWATLRENGIETDTWPGTRLEVVNLSTGHALWGSKGDFGAASLWSPDGKYLALVRQTEGDSTVTILETAYFHAFEPLWDLDGAKSKTALEWVDEHTLRIQYLQEESGEKILCRCIPTPETDGSISGKYLREETATLLGNYDFDHDGASETVELTELADGSLAWYELRVVDRNGITLWATAPALWHGGYTSVYACRLDGMDYLLQYEPEMWQGWADYAYRLFSLDEDGEAIVQEGDVSFDCNFNMDGHSFDKEAIADFLWDLRGCLTDSRLLISTEGGTLYTDGAISAAEVPAYFSSLLELDSREAMLEALRQDEAELKAEQGIA